MTNMDDEVWPPTRERNTLGRRKRAAAVQRRIERQREIAKVKRDSPFVDHPGPPDKKSERRLDDDESVVGHDFNQGLPLADPERRHP